MSDEGVTATIIADGTRWAGAIVAVHPAGPWEGYRPAVLLYCAHGHRLMESALACARRELEWVLRAELEAPGMVTE